MNIHDELAVDHTPSPAFPPPSASAGQAQIVRHEDTLDPWAAARLDAEHTTRGAIDDLMTISVWHVSIGLPDTRLAANPDGPWCPAEVRVAWRRLMALKAGDLQVPSTPLTSLNDALDTAISGLSDPRFITIVKGRFFAEEKRSLDDIGLVLGMTRERVRQLEKKAAEECREALLSDPLISQVADVLTSQGFCVLPLENLLSSMPSLGEMVPSIEQPGWRVLQWLDPTLDICDGWCVRPSMRGAINHTHEVLANLADNYGVASLDGLDLVSTNDPALSAETLRRWLHHCGIMVDGQFALIRTGSRADYAAAILSLAGEPLSSHQIADRFAFERSNRSLRTALAMDDRFDRVDRDRWALREWKMDTYSTVREQIGHALSKHGGALSLGAW